VVTGRPKIQIEGLTVRYGKETVLENVTLDVAEHEVLGVIGPAGAGKTTLLRVLNRTIDLVPGARVEGSVRIDGEDVLAMRDLPALRRRIGMVAPLPVGLPMSIFDNVAFAPRMAGVRDKKELRKIVQTSLTHAALWEEVENRLDDLGTKLSGGQQQRLTIARALSHDPEILCLDEFSIAVDPVTTMRIEDVLKELHERITIVLVTNLVQQARRLAHRTAFFLQGELVEVGPTEDVFGRTPKDRRTFEYVHGLFG
jgi:phosphate transport system ATP-binding protein